MPRLKHLVAICLGIGLTPVSPGTACSAAMIVIGAAIFSAAGAAGLAAAAAAAVIAGFWSTADVVPSEDPQQIVIDEAAGQLLALLPVPLWLNSALIPTGAGILAWLAAFALFRLFDIWKPGFIGRIDRSGRPGTIMYDDLLAGVAAAAVLLAAWMAMILLVRSA